MTNWFLHLQEQERRRDEIERAAARHHAHAPFEPDHATIKPPRRHEIILAALGDRLVKWGSHLQTRYRRLAQQNARTAGGA